MTLIDRWRRLWATADYDPSRRGFFGVAAGGIVAAVVSPLVPTMILSEAFAPSAMVYDYSEMAAITRKAFVPSMFVQLYTSNPMLAMMSRGGAA